MKVIQDNRPMERFKFPLLITCTRCASKLEADREDIKTYDGDERTGRDGGFYVECSLCHARVNVKP